MIAIKCTDWSIKRSGAAMTLEVRLASGVSQSIPTVVSLMHGPAGPVGTGRNGVEFSLQVEGAAA